MKARNATASESDVVKSIAQAIKILGVYAWRNNTGAVKAGSRYIRYGKKGSGDFLGVLGPDGRFLAIEAKQPGEKQSADQIEFQAEVEARGGMYLLVERGVDIIEPINNHRKRRRNERQKTV